MKKITIIFLVCAVYFTNSHAQSYVGTHKFAIGWEVGMPSNDFISGTTYRGGKIEYGYMIKPNLSVGLGTSWNSFEEYVPKTTYQKPDGSGAITTDIVRDLYTLPLTLNLKYYLKAGDKIKPYAGIGLGGMYADQTIYFNIYGIEDNNWGFVARPELGLTYSFNASSAIYLSGTYNYATNQSDFFYNDNLSHFALSIGFVFSQ